jgi:hypothetical protein
MAPKPSSIAPQPDQRSPVVSNPVGKTRLPSPYGEDSKLSEAPAALMQAGQDPLVVSAGSETAEPTREPRLSSPRPSSSMRDPPLWLILLGAVLCCCAWPLTARCLPTRSMPSGAGHSKLSADDMNDNVSCMYDTVAQRSVAGTSVSLSELQSERL